ncbi:divalent-cation tolerance protein CutA [Leptospira wolffii]|uniref:divalent-cation tolerance protein CutA n=1 Tax=Leptospira wolffii TaxID=409998 RepID=UPI0003483FB4|nr:divalent-cation tolerance protein CutA [Leptospira wolffii]TGK62197.1 divalent-cation tolerance protein CutA [Leptospira wolffii]TGK66568.1 divalent-cation tolerance protein CutA [Leptospira wolffii]TGK74419.1 divalent-cation tolerance protein CutA [Leptospira wolffii]TGL32006.1 divalent-cation tolerance protein CutA [Leptospira wolffii]
MDYRTFYITTKNEAEALEIAEALVKERLVACANMIPGMKSIYHWHGRLEVNQETVLLLKTRAGLSEKVIARVGELHSYTIPCIVSWEIREGNKKYLQWIDSETGK